MDPNCIHDWPDTLVSMAWSKKSYSFMGINIQKSLVMMTHIFYVTMIIKFLGFNMKKPYIPRAIKVSSINNHHRNYDLSKSSSVKTTTKSVGPYRKVMAHDKITLGFWSTSSSKININSVGRSRRWEDPVRRQHPVRKTSRPSFKIPLSGLTRL